MRTVHYQRGDGEWVTEVVLSRRNIMALLAKLNGYPRTSACALRGPVFYPETIVRAEEDEVHYAHESRQGAAAGPMHPDTESQLIARDAHRNPEFRSRQSGRLPQAREFIRATARRDFS